LLAIAGHTSCEVGASALPPKPDIEGAAGARREMTLSGHCVRQSLAPDLFGKWTLAGHVTTTIRVRCMSGAYAGDADRDNVGGGGSAAGDGANVYVAHPEAR